MEVLQYLGTISDGHEVVMTTQKYTPYAIVTGYNHDTMSWASAYGYYTNLGDMARAIAKLESDIIKNKMINDLMELSDVCHRIYENYEIIEDIDEHFADAFSEGYPFYMSFGDMGFDDWIYMLTSYLNGSRKVGETEEDEDGNWCKPKED